jgi:outer membrane lipoprotein-sorting protein
MRNLIFLILTVSFLSACAQKTKNTEKFAQDIQSKIAQAKANTNLKVATFAGGCFLVY